VVGGELLAPKGPRHLQPALHGPIDAGLEIRSVSSEEVGILRRDPDKPPQDVVGDDLAVERVQQVVRVALDVDLA
jgi:hypothetical protein